MGRLMWKAKLFQVPKVEVCKLDGVEVDLSEDEEPFFFVSTYF